MRLLADVQNPDYPNVVYGHGHLLDMDPDQAFRLRMDGKVNILDDQIASPLVDHSVTTTNNTATISWTTTMPTSGLIRYGIETRYGQVEADQIIDVSHAVLLSGLRNNTRYHYQIVGSADGVSIESRDFELLTGNLEIGQQPAGTP